MANNSISDQIFLSRDAIRDQIIEYTKTYLELENVDLTKPSFLTYLINILSTLTSNILFYQLSTHKEFFLTEAQLPENILNLSAFIGYTPSDASYATTNVLMTFPLTFDDSIATFQISDGFKFQTSDKVIFSTYYTVDVTVTGNSAVTAVLEETNAGIKKTYNLPLTIDTDNNTCSISLPVRQYE